MGLAGELPHEKGQELRCRPLPLEREADLSLHPSVTEFLPSAKNAVGFHNV